MEPTGNVHTRIAKAMCTVEMFCKTRKDAVVSARKGRGWFVSRRKTITRDSDIVTGDFMRVN